MTTALSIKNLKKRYSNNLLALKDVNLKVKAGDFFALLGVNGAGKTTAIGIISGLLKKSSGSVEVFGINQEKSPNEIKKMIGLMPQEFNFNPFEPVEEILINQAGFYGIKKKDSKENIEKLLKKMQLWDKRKGMAKQLSGGMKRRMMLARALVHNPKVLILDEPTAGVDVEIRHSMWEYFKELNESGMTIILTTHYLEEAESLCKNIAILDKGKVVIETSTKSLLQKESSQTLLLESKSKLPKIVNNDTFDIKRLDDYSLEINIPKDININTVITYLSKNNIYINHIRNKHNRLESLFLCLI